MREQEPETKERSGQGRFKAISSLRNRNFFLLWVGMFASVNGMQMLIVARGWLVYTMTESPLALGLVAAGMGAPLVLFSLFGGAVADRVRKRNLLLVTQSCICLLNITMTILISTHLVALWHLVASSIVTGVIFSFSMPTRQALIVELVGPDDLTNAIAMNSMAMNICRIASPALAGLLIKLIDIPGVYLIVVFSYATSMITLMMIPPGGVTTAGPHVPLIRDVVAGLRYIRDNSTLLALLIIAIVPILFATPYQMLMPVFAKSIFNAGETGLGLLMSAGGVGALCGSAFIASLGNIQRKGVLMVLTGTIFGIALVLFGLSKTLLLALICLVFVGSGGSMFMTLITSLIMVNTPNNLIGRVMSIFIMTFGLMPLAMLPAGALAKVFGAPLIVSVGSGIFTVVLISIAVTQPRIRKLH
jgi:MFS family permease